jgi:hypothetical protein
MSSEIVSITDQEGISMPQHLASAERELFAFVAAVDELFGPEQARHAADNWIEELEQTDWTSEAQAIDWRPVTIAAAARLVGRDKRSRSKSHEKGQSRISGTTRKIMRPNGLISIERVSGLAGN